MDTHDCTNIDTLESKCEQRIHAIEKLDPTKSHVRRWRRAARASACGLAAALAAFTATPAAATVNILNWQFGMDVICDQTLHTVSIVNVGFSPDRTSAADSAYRYWVQVPNGNGWYGPSEWRVIAGRNAYYEGPYVLSSVPGLYQFYVQYALYTTQGWMFNEEFANHRTSIGGFTNSGGLYYCVA